MNIGLGHLDFTPLFYGVVMFLGIWMHAAQAADREVDRITCRDRQAAAVSIAFASTLQAAYAPIDACHAAALARSEVIRDGKESGR